MKKIEVACYHWSNWHPTPGNDRDRGKGWTEWEYLKQAIPRFPGHKQPISPLWGYLDDSKMETIQLQIDTAADYGIDTFIFDWGYKGNDVCLNLFMNAPNTNRMKFALMECGGVLGEKETLEKFDYIIDTFFTRPNYWKVNGACYYSLYELGKHVRHWGGVENAKRIFTAFREKAAAKGFKIHFVAVEWGLQEFCCQDLDPQELVRELGVDALTSYTWYHNITPAWPCGDYADWAEAAYDKMTEIEQKYPVPYYTHVSMGWDPSPRCPATMKYELGGPLMYHTLSGEYQIQHKPYLSSIVKENTPAEFRRALLAAKRHLNDTQPENPIVTLYAWNEWTEGGHLEPDSVYGYGYLESIKDIFKK